MGVPKRPTAQKCIIIGTSIIATGTGIKTLYSYFDQARRHLALEPLLVVKMNRERPLAVIDMEHLFELIEDK